MIMLRTLAHNDYAPYSGIFYTMIMLGYLSNFASKSLKLFRLLLKLGEKLLPKTSNISNKASLTLSLQKSLPYRNQSIDLQSKGMDWFLYDWDLRHERNKHFALQY